MMEAYFFLSQKQQFVLIEDSFVKRNQALRVVIAPHGERIIVCCLFVGHKGSVGDEQR
jgi:hypothetical protein